MLVTSDNSLLKNGMVPMVGVVHTFNHSTQAEMGRLLHSRPGPANKTTHKVLRDYKIECLKYVWSSNTGLLEAIVLDLPQVH